MNKPLTPIDALWHTLIGAYLVDRWKHKPCAAVLNAKPEVREALAQLKSDDVSKASMRGWIVPTDKPKRVPVFRLKVGD